MELVKDQNINQNETQDEELDTRKVVLKKPFEFEGKTYTEIDLSGLDDLTGADLEEADRYLKNSGEYFNPLKQYDSVYTNYIASRAANLPVEFFQKLKIKDAEKVRVTVTRFFTASE